MSREFQFGGSEPHGQHTDDEQATGVLSADRRELWWLESFLAVNGTTPRQHDRRLMLYRYLCLTCTHCWSDVSGWGGSPKGTRQCDWCNYVLAPGGSAPDPMDPHLALTHVRALLVPVPADEDGDTT